LCLIAACLLPRTARGTHIHAWVLMGDAGGHGPPSTAVRPLRDPSYFGKSGEGRSEGVAESTPTSSRDTCGGASLDESEGELPSSSWFWHEVDINDSLAGLAVRYGVSQGDIKVSNALKLGDAIIYKKRLRIPRQNTPRSVIEDLGRASNRDAASLKLKPSLNHRRALSGDIEMRLGAIPLDPLSRGRENMVDNLTARLRAVYSDEPGTEHRIPRPLQMDRDMIPSTSTDLILPDEAVSGSALASNRTAPVRRTTRSAGDRTSSSGSAGGWSTADQRQRMDHVPRSSAYGMPGHVARRKDRQGASSDKVKGDD